MLIDGCLGFRETGLHPVISLLYKNQSCIAVTFKLAFVYTLINSCNLLPVVYMMYLLNPAF